MMSRIALLLLSLFPLAGAAQSALPSLAMPGGTTPLVEQLLTLDPGGRSQLAQGTSVLPIWSGSSGELLAVVAVPPGWTSSPVDSTPAYAGPSSWHLVGNTSSAAGLRWTFGHGLRADALLGEYLADSPSFCLTDACAHRAPGSLAGSLGLGWSSGEGSLDLSYGLSWLQPQDRVSLGDLTTDSALLPVLSLPDSRLYSLDGERALYARGRWQFERGPALDVAASYGRSHVLPLGTPGAAAFGPGLDLDQLSLSLGLDAGSLRGAIVGHVISSDDPALAGKRWTTLDLGLSWRTPWSGELSVGAQNLWTAPQSSPRDAENQTRTPYIQYRQDL